MPSLPTLVLMDRKPHRPSRRRLFSLLLALFLGPGLSLSGFSMASAQVLPASQRAAANTPMVNDGGPIESDPEVLLDFWGPNWANASGQSQITAIVGLFSSLSGGSYLNILRVYGVHNHVTLVNVQGSSYFYDSSNPGSALPFTGNLYDPTAISEMQRAIQAAGLSTSTHYPNLQVMIFPDPNTSYGPNGQGCGWHNFDSTGTTNVYSIIPYPNTNNCQLHNSYPGDLETGLLEAIATHEFAEAVTDPEPSVAPAWTSSAGEIGDQCGGDNKTYQPHSQPGKSYVTQQLSNPAGNCVAGYGNEYSSPDVAPLTLASIPSHRLCWVPIRPIRVCWGTPDRTGGCE